MSSTQPVLTADSISVSYRVPSRRFGSLKEYVVARLRGEKVDKIEFKALDDVSVRVYPGECVGLLGHNGSGKSTLLKVMSGILKAQTGKVVTVGRLTSLIELGAGFDPELPAADNILLSCTLMGFPPKEIKLRIADILKFAELEDFQTFPLKNYSSGMYARLGFACATAIDPDIVLIDEVIGVGDEAFQIKCHTRLNQLRAAGKAIILVTHDTHAVRKFCSRVYCLHHGKVMFEGDTEAGIEKYRVLLGLPGKPS